MTGPVFRHWPVVVRAGLGLLLAVSAVLKLADPAAFASDIEHYRLVGPLVSAVVAVYLPWLELALAIAWWPRRVRSAAGALVLAMLVAFTVAVGSAWARGLDLDCGCFGAAAAMPVRWALLRNLVLLVFAAALWRHDLKKSAGR